MRCTVLLSVLLQPALGDGPANPPATTAPLPLLFVDDAIIDRWDEALTLAAQFMLHSSLPPYIAFSINFLSMVLMFALFVAFYAKLARTTNLPPTMAKYGFLGGLVLISFWPASYAV